MSDFDDLIVYLVDLTTGTPLVTFDTVKTIPKNSNRRRQCAVEAQANQRFGIQVQVNGDFDWAGCNGLEVRVGFDVGEQVNCRSVYLLKDAKLAELLALPQLTYDGLVHSHCISHLLIENTEVEHGVSRAHFHFRQLRSDDSVPAAPGLPRTLDSQGKIRIEVARTIINKKEQDRGLQVDTVPTYRRQTKQNLLRKGITLEVLLHVDMASGPVVYKGNFRSERPKDRSTQANFDFIYREVNHHDLRVAASDIVEVRSSERKSLSGREGTTSPSSLSRRSSVLPAATPNPHTTRQPGIDTDFAAHPTTAEVQPRAVVVTTTSETREPSTLATSNLSQTDSSSQQTLPSLPSDRPSTSTPAAGTPPTMDRREHSVEISRLEKCITMMRNQLEKNAAQQVSCQEHANIIRAQADELDIKSASLKATQKELETQQQKLRDMYDRCMAKVQEAIDVFVHDTEEVKQEVVEATSDKKRKRNE